MSVSMDERITLGKWTEDSLNELLYEASSISQPGERIAFLSEKFIGTAYLESTLIGSKDTSEVFVINLEQVDCLAICRDPEARLLAMPKDFGVVGHRPEMRERIEHLNQFGGA